MTIASRGRLGDWRASVAAAPRAWAGVWGLVPYLLLAFAATPVAYWKIFSRFATYDDEGYLLVSLQSFLHGGALYDDVFTQYGPAYYELFGALFKLAGETVSTNAGRLIVVGIWIATSGLVGIAVQRLTSRLVLGVAAQLVAFAVLGLLVAEPMHPVGLSCFLLVALAAIAAFTSGSVGTRHVLAAALAGTVLALLTLTKINLGAFAIAAAAFALTVALPELRALRIPVASAFVALPVLLVGPDLDEQWVQDLVLLVSSGAGALAVATWEAPVRGGAALRDRLRVIGYASSAFGATAGAVVLVILALGSSVSGVIDGVLVQPTKLREAFRIPFVLPGGAAEWSLLAIAAAFVARAATRDRSPWPGLLRIAAGLAIWLSVTATAPLDVATFPQRLLLPALLAWIAALPPQGVVLSARARFARTFIPALAVAETLQVYPVAGTQVLASALLYVPVGAICIADGCAALERTAFDPRWARRLAQALTLALVAKFALSFILRPLDESHGIYRAQQALPFGGATRVHLPVQDVESYSRIIELLRTRCSTFVTLPGMNSLYLWANRRPPTGLNAGDWVKLLDDRRQQRVVDAARRTPRLCAVRNRTLLANWGQPTGHARRPLLRYIERYFVPIADVGGYEVMVRRPTP